jgi:peroxiredoxin
LIDAFGLRHVDGGMEGDIARPAVLVFDRDGRVVWRHLTDNWRVRVRPDQLLEVLAGIP